MKQTGLLLSGTWEGPILAQALLDAGLDVRVCKRFDAGRRGACARRDASLCRADYTNRCIGVCPFGRAVCALSVAGLGPPAETTVYAAGYAEAAALLPELGSRILLTLGAKQLKHFAHLHERLTLFARVLPSPASVQQALDAGFAQGRILALRPPFSQASGVAGGVVEKVLAAHEMGLTTVMIHRPVQPELAVVSSVAAAVQACQA
jgi:hypothetical protein